MAKAYNTCIAPQAAYRSCSDAVHVTNRAGIQPIGCRLSLRHRLTYDQPAIRSPGLPFNGLHPVIRVMKAMDYYSLSEPGGMEG